MNILRFIETFRTYKTVKNTKTIQNKGFFFDIFPNYCNIPRLAGFHTINILIVKLLGFVK